MIVSSGVPKADKVLSHFKRISPGYGGGSIYDLLNEDPNIITVVGGDGMLLKAAAEYGTDDYAYLPLNAGSLGFLLNNTDDLRKLGRDIYEKNWFTHRYPLLSGTFYKSKSSGKIKNVTKHALNDITVERASGQTARLSIYLDGERIVDNLVGDGVVISTAIGSTGYNFSAGGPVCHPTLNTLSVTPIAPHHPRLSPFVVPGNSKLKIVPNQVEKRPVRVNVDGRAIEGIQDIDINGYAESKGLEIIYLGDYSFSKHLRKVSMRG